MGIHLAFQFIGHPSYIHVCAHEQISLQTRFLGVECMDQKIFARLVSVDTATLLLTQAEVYIFPPAVWEWIALS